MDIEDIWRSAIESAQKQLAFLSLPFPEEEDLILLLECYVRRLGEMKYDFTPQGAGHVFVEMLRDLGPSVYPSTASPDPILQEDWIEILPDEAVNAFYWRFPEIAEVLFPRDFAKEVIREFDAFNARVDEQKKQAETRRAAQAS